MPKDDQDGVAEGVDLSGMGRMKGATFYGSTKLEQVAGGWRVQGTASVTYIAPDDEPFKVSLEKHQQLHAEALRRVTENGIGRRISVETNSDVGDMQYETDYINPRTGEILDVPNFVKGKRRTEPKIVPVVDSRDRDEAQSIEDLPF